MDKIILKDKTEIEVKQMPTIGAITTVVADVAALQELKDKLTADNISAVQTQNAAGLTVGTYADQVLIDMWEIRWIDEGIEATFGLRDKTEVEVLEAKMDAANAVQDGAIEDLGTAVSELAAGGVQ